MLFTRTINDQEPLNAPPAGADRSSAKRDHLIRGRKQHSRTAETRRRTNSKKVSQRATSPRNRATIHERVQHKLRQDQLRRKTERRRRKPAGSQKQSAGVTVKPLNDAVPKTLPPRTRSSSTKGSGKYPWHVTITPPRLERSASKSSKSKKSSGGILDDLTVSPVSLLDYFTVGNNEDNEFYDYYDDYEDYDDSDDEYDDDLSYYHNEEESHLERNITAEASQFFSMVTDAADQFDMAAGPVLDTVSKFMGRCMNLDALEYENTVVDSVNSERDEVYSRGAAEVSIVSADSIASNKCDDENSEQSLHDEIDSVLVGENSLASVELNLQPSKEPLHAFKDVGSLRQNSKEMKEKEKFRYKDGVGQFKEVHVAVTALALSGLTVQSKSKKFNIDENSVKAVLSVLRPTTSSDHTIYTHIPSLVAVRDPIKSAIENGQPIAKPLKKHHLLAAWPFESTPIRWEENETKHVQVMDGSYECAGEKIFQNVPNKRLGALASSIGFSRLIGVTKFSSTASCDEYNGSNFPGQEEHKYTFIPSVVELRICIMKENREILPVGVAKVVISGEEQDAELTVPVIQDYWSSFNEFVRNEDQSSGNASSIGLKKEGRKSKSFVRFKSAKEEIYSLEPNSFLRIRLQVRSTRQERNSPYPPANLGLSILTPNYIPKGKEFGKLSLVLRKRYKKHLKAEKRLQSLKFALANTKSAVGSGDENHTATSDGSSLGSTAGGVVDQVNPAETDKIIQKTTALATKAPEKATMPKGWKKESKTDQNFERMTNGDLAAEIHISNDLSSMNEPMLDVNGVAVDESNTTNMIPAPLKKQAFSVSSKNNQPLDHLGILSGKKSTEECDRKDYHNDSRNLHHSLSMRSEESLQDNSTDERKVSAQGKIPSCHSNHAPRSRSNFSASTASVGLLGEKSANERESEDILIDSSMYHHSLSTNPEIAHAESICRKSSESFHGAKALTRSRSNTSASIASFRLPGKKTPTERVVKDLHNDYTNCIHHSLKPRSELSCQEIMTAKIEDSDCGAESLRQFFHSPRKISDISGTAAISSGKKSLKELYSGDVQKNSTSYNNHSPITRTETPHQDVIVDNESVAPTVIATFEDEGCREFELNEPDDSMNVMLQINYTYSRGTIGEQQEDYSRVAGSISPVSPSAKRSDFNQSELDATVTVGCRGDDIKSEVDGVEIGDLEHILEREEEVMEPDDGVEVSTPCEV